MDTLDIKPIEIRFAQFYAAGGFTIYECVERTLALSDKKRKPNTMSSLGSKWLKKEAVQAYIAYYRDELLKKSLIDADWIRQELVTIVRQGKHADARGALDTLNKMNGYYAKDNEQQQANVTLQMEF